MPLKLLGVLNLFGVRDVVEAVATYEEVRVKQQCSLRDMCYICS